MEVDHYWKGEFNGK